jgi:hypothetical protein
MEFCTDMDLLHWEPTLFRDAVFASQELLGGTGDLNETTFTLASGSLLTAHVAANQVIVFSGSLSGSYPIVSVNSERQLAFMVLYDGLPQSPGTERPLQKGLSFAIRTFQAQRRVVSDLMMRAAGIDLGSVVTPRPQIVNLEAMRRPCVLGTLQSIYNTLAAAATNPNGPRVSADLYERLYRRALGQVVAEVDSVEP